MSSFSSHTLSQSPRRDAVSLGRVPPAFASLSHDVWLSSREAARALQCTQDYITRLCREGELECRREGRVWFVNASSLLRYFTKAQQTKRELRAARSEQMRSWWQEQRGALAERVTQVWLEMLQPLGVTLLITGMLIIGIGVVGVVAPAVLEKERRLSRSDEEGAANVLQGGMQRLRSFVFGLIGSNGREARDSEAAPTPSSQYGVVVEPRNEGEQRRDHLTYLFSEPVEVVPEDDRSGVVRSRLAPEEPFLYLMVPVRAEEVSEKPPP